MVSNGPSMLGRFAFGITLGFVGVSLLTAAPFSLVGLRMPQL